MPYTCNYCGGTHCKSHKLPEKHDCPNIAAANTLGPELRREYQTVPTASRKHQIKTALLVVGGLALVLGLITALFLI